MRRGEALLWLPRILILSPLWSSLKSCVSATTSEKEIAISSAKSSVNSVCPLRRFQTKKSSPPKCLSRSFGRTKIFWSDQSSVALSLRTLRTYKYCIVLQPTVDVLPSSSGFSPLHFIIPQEKASSSWSALLSHYYWNQFECGERASLWLCFFLKIS